MKKSRKRRKIELNLKKQTQFQKSQNERKVNYNKEIRGIYWIGHLVKTNPIQSQTKPIAGVWLGIRSTKFEIRNELKGYDLKKQSQFSQGQIGAKSVITIVYGDFDGPGRRENKANSKPNKANSKPIAGLWLEILNKAGGEKFLGLAVFCR